MSSSLTNPCAGLWSSPSHWEAAFRAAVLSRYGERRCCLCDAPPEVIEAAHIVPVSDDGRDWGTSTGDTSNWVWSPWSLAVFRSGGSAASFGGVTWHVHKAVGSSASHWNGSGRRNSGRGSGAMVAQAPGRKGLRSAEDDGSQTKPCHKTLQTL